MRAARGPLADAVLHYVTATSLIALAAPVMVAVALPVALWRRSLSTRPWVVAAAAAIVVAGPFAAARVDTRGLHRNAVGALIATSPPRMDPAAGAADWRASPFAQPQGENLSALRGTMKGRNVILVVLESTGARHLGAYGGTPDPTPNLTALARRSIVFERAYVIAINDKPRRIQRVASAIDTAPTILDLVGLPAEALHQGTSLLRPEPRMALFFTDYSIGWLGLADGCWKYLFEMDSGRSHLFDVCADPGESRDRAGEFPDRVTSYRTRVREWAAAQKDAIRRR